MSETVIVEMEAQQRVRYSLRCNMEKADWDEYNRLVNSDISSREREEAIEAIAENYRLDNCDNIYDWDDMEDVEITLFKPEETQEFDYSGAPPFPNDDMCIWCAGTGHPGGDPKYGSCEHPEKETP